MRPQVPVIKRCWQTPEVVVTKQGKQAAAAAGAAVAAAAAAAARPERGSPVLAHVISTMALAAGRSSAAVRLYELSQQVLRNGHLLAEPMRKCHTFLYVKRHSDTLFFDNSFLGVLF
ncbi:Protein of unknown function [Gryllus bimaculatus]|nr:Protein of unknown function [Gryllus bimaculatus]